ncbi:MAG: hypothetical protein P8J50_13095 [Acidimicrobiales bacterium]|nr:hypothetical protein [Acidimicrobiales bacterium]
MQTSSRFRPAPVLSGLGTFLLTVAAVSFVAARWDRFGPGGRCAALLAFSVLVLGAGMALRRAAPVTAGALDVLTAALVSVDVAALAIVGGASWPAVLLVAGPVAVISAELLRSRSPAARPVAEIGTVVGGVLAAAAAGVGAGYELAMAPLVAGIGLLGCTMHPWSRERVAGVAWSALAGLAPALWVLDDVAFTCDGTMRRFGLLEPTEWVLTVIAGSMAVVGLSIAAARRRSLISERPRPVPPWRLRLRCGRYTSRLARS